jgi:N-methylhydantoinase A
LYEGVFGAGTAYRQAGIEAMMFRVTATATSRTAAAGGAADGAGLAAQPSGSRRAYFNGWVDQTPVFTAEVLMVGQRIQGPALIDSVATTTVIHPAQSALVDHSGNLRILFGGQSTGGR